MGQFLFDVPDESSEFIQQSLWKDAYVCGIEGIPWQSSSQFDGSRLTITRSIESSGKLLMACPIKGIGYRTLSTCSLRPVAEPHLLPLELARGSCHRARSQSDTWQRAGLTLSQKFLDLVDQGTELFLDAAQRRADPEAAAVSSLEAITILEEAIMDLGESYAVQSIAFRKQREPQIGTLLAGTIVPPSPTDPANSAKFREAFNSAAVRLSWANIETDAGRYDYEQAEQSVRWCVDNGLRVIGGPLIDFRDKLMPHWLYLLEDNFDNFLSAVVDFVEKTVVKFRGSVQLWNCAASLNTPGPLDLSDEQVMRLALGVLQTVRRIDPNTPTIVTFDQPYGEYLSKHRDGISPLHFADALARSGLGMAGLGLDFRMNYSSHSTLPRSAVDFGQMIDRWATLGMPLLVQLSVPGQIGADADAIAPTEVLRMDSMTTDPASDQLRLAAPLIRTLLAKHIVHGIVWDGWSDAEPHVQSHSGVINAKGQPRPLLEYLSRVRREFLA
ncbi:MAG: glycoside hydrolase family 10 [Pirellulaceae bacterium]|nr:glycoside hydrolase family 10 [Pirellulaceae bacterium]